MSDTGKQSPLGANFLNALLLNSGLFVNRAFREFVGTSTELIDPNYQFGSVVGYTVLRHLTYAINAAYNGNSSGKPSDDVYNNLISIGGQTGYITITSITSTTNKFTVTYSGSVTFSPGSYILITGASPVGYNGSWQIATSTSNSFTITDVNNYGTATNPGTFTYNIRCPALGNSKPPNYTWTNKIGPYGVRPDWDTQGWGGNLYKANNPSTSWGFLRLLALQSQAEWNYNNTQPEYRDFLGSFLNAHGFIESINRGILSVSNSINFLEGTFSQMSDLITADITAVNKATLAWGQDLVKLGKALDLSTIDSFGLPSNLLKLLIKNNALTKSISLALFAANITNNDIENILNGAISGYNIERQLYAVFLITVGDSLTEVLSILRCNTLGITSLADLLNPKKLFPNSYQSLTVPNYNTVPITNTSTPSTPNFPNSRISLVIYFGNNVNPELNNSLVINNIGYSVPAGIPPINVGAVNNVSDINMPAAAQFGAGSISVGAVPTDIAMASGAFAVAMSQIRNIKNVPIEKFAQIVYNLEVINNNVTPNIDGTNVPIDKQLRENALPLIALGSGPQGSYTMGDFFGCVSGTPYNGPLSIAFQKLGQLATSFLYTTYKNLYLAVTWEKPEAALDLISLYTLVTPYNPGNPSAIPPVPATPATWDVYYQITGIRLINRGGGYRREDAPNPNVYIPGTSGAVAAAITENNVSFIPTTYGRITSLRLVNAGQPVKFTTVTVNNSGNPSPVPPPTIIPEIESPPISPARGPNGGPNGTNSPYSTVGWPFMNTITQQYINYANEEIARIVSNPNNAVSVRQLNDAWNAIGEQLTIEQRARETGLKPALKLPRDNELSTFPMVQYSFVDTMPTFAVSTEPHMYSQTIQAISDLSTAGGQSAIGMMSEDRNQNRLEGLGIVLDNNIPDSLTPTELSVLIANGSLPVGESNVPTPAATLVQYINDTPLSPVPYGYYDPNPDIYIIDRSPIYQGYNDGNITFVDNGGGGIDQSPYVNTMPPYLNTFYFSNNLLPSTYTVDQALENINLCKHGPLDYVPYNYYQKDYIKVIGGVSTLIPEFPPQIIGSNIPAGAEIPPPIEVLATPPVANFIGIPLTGQEPLTVNFTDLSTNNPTTWAWDFTNDGTIDSTLQNPSYTYTTPGIYSVKLYVTNAGGGTSLLKSNYITVTIKPPVANFVGSPLSGNPPLTVNFVDTSTGDPTSWAWDFTNDGTTDSTLQNPSTTYANPGNYSVKLTASNSGGSNSITKTNYVVVYVPFNVTWTTSTTGLIPSLPGGWVITNSGRTIRFNVQNSQNCGGPNGSRQTGVATATIITDANTYLFNPVLTGIGEAQDPGYDNMYLYLNGVMIRRATSAGGGLGCAPNVPVVQTVLVPPPYTLLPNSTYTFTLEFTTTDSLYHINSYYECDINFTIA